MSRSEYSIIKERLLSRGQLFEDPEFPATARSISSSGYVSRDIQWRRPKEISRSPKFFIGGKSRTDIHQGELGDCWFIAGVACLATTNQKLLARVVPGDQSFDTDYAGIFRFNFWEFDKWVEVIIDDRLPTRYGRLIYCANRTKEETNEYWGALLEKAYAKFRGGYYNIEGGFINDAMVDMTGGISEKFHLDKDRRELEPVLYDLLYRTARMASMMGCSIPSTTLSEEAMSNGLYKGHAYSITQIATLNVFGKTVRLLRLRNPWGRGEWNGLWGDNSREWRNVPSDKRKELGLEPKEDGEFWMEYSDWINSFEKLDICHLVPDSYSQEVAQDMNKREWEVSKHHGEWIKGISAGGCGNAPYQRLFWTNPQFSVTLGKADDVDADGKCTNVISLMSKARADDESVFISFSVYKLRDRYPILLNGQNYDKKALYLYKQAATYTNVREVTSHQRVEPGTYVVIPTTFEPNKEGSFYLRVFTETAAKTEVVDEPTVIEEEEDKEDSLLTLFNKHSGGEQRVDASELQNVLGEVYRLDLQNGFGIDVCRSLLAVMDRDKSGLLNFEEFRLMIKELNVWKGAFRGFDKDRSGSIDTYELSEVFKALGFTLSRSVLTSIIRRYGGKKRTLAFEDFIQCCSKIVVLYSMFNKKAKKDSDPKVIEMQLEEWLAITMLY